MVKRVQSAHSRRHSDSSYPQFGRPFRVTFTAVSALHEVVSVAWESKMSDRARYFLNDWFDDHIKPLPAVERLAEAVRLATRCRQDATAAGIPLQEIRDMVGGDLIRKILHALDIAATLHDQVPLVPETSALVEG